MRYVTLALLLGLALVLGGCGGEGDEDGEARTGKPERNDDSLAYGKTVYDKNCAKCHGDTGKGDGPSRGVSIPKPRDFTTKTFKYVTTKNLVPTEDDLYKTVSKGVPGTQMEAYEGTLSDYDCWAAVYYVQKLAGLEGVAPEALAIPDKPAGADAKKGERIFLAQCSKCHGVKGEGDGVAAGTLRDMHGDIIPPRNLLTDEMAGGGSDKDLYCRIKLGIPGTAMVVPEGYAEIKDEDVWHLVAFINSLRK